MPNKEEKEKKRLEKKKDRLAAGLAASLESREGAIGGTSTPNPQYSDDSDEEGMVGDRGVNVDVTRLEGGADNDEANLLEGHLTPRELASYLRNIGVPLDEGVTEVMLASIYHEMVRAEADLHSIPAWSARIDLELNNYANQAVSSLDIKPSFHHQIWHFLDLCGLKRKDWKKIVDAVVFKDDDFSINLLDRMVYACRYIGFDPSVILRKVIRSHRESMNTPKQTFVLIFEANGVSQEWVYSNHEGFIKDMTFLLIIFLQRGAVVAKISKKSSRDFQAVLRMLISKYNIRANDETDRRRRTEALGPEIITLPRLAACFCQLTVTLFHFGYGRTIANFTEFGNAPPAMFSPMFPSVVRKTYIRNNIKYNIHPQLVLIAILVDNVLHIRDKPTPLELIWTYYLASYQSSVMLDNARIDQCDIYGVTVEGYFIDNIINLREHCRNRIRELRPHERIDELLKEMDDIA
jgi:hypothetical protein